MTVQCIAASKDMSLDWLRRSLGDPFVDLLVQSASGWILTEVKSGSTVHSSFFQGMEGLAGRLKDIQPIGGD